MGNHPDPETFVGDEERLDFYRGASLHVGSFVAALAEAALKADALNLRKIKETWPQDWSKYAWEGAAIRRRYQDE